MLLLLSAILGAICLADSLEPTCWSTYGVSINPDDCDYALQQPFVATLWTRMKIHNVVETDQYGVLNLDWHPLRYSARANTTDATVGANFAEGRLPTDNEVCSDSGLVARYRLSRESAPDDFDNVFRLPMVRTHASCGIGIDIVSTSLPYNWKSMDRPLDAFHAVGRVLESCTEGGSARGQGGMAFTPLRQLRVMVTDAELMLNLPMHMTQTLEQVVVARARQRVAEGHR